MDLQIYLIELPWQECMFLRLESNLIPLKSLVDKGTDHKVSIEQIRSAIEINVQHGIRECDFH